MRVMPRPCLASGISARMRAACQPIRASTSGSASRTPPTRLAMPPKSCSGKSAMSKRPSKERMDEQIAQRTAAYIKRQAAAQKPFFVYVGFIHLHPPMGVNPEFAGKSGSGFYADMLTEMDYRTGQILDALQAAGVADNTIVVLPPLRWPALPEVRMGRGGVTSSIRLSRAVTGFRR